MTDVISLKGSVGIVTGAGRGIGRATALRLAEEGMSMILAARTEAEIQAVAEECAKKGARAHPVVADVSKEADVRELAAQAVSSGGKIDLLVNNAGIGFFAPVVEMPVTDFDAMWSINLRGIFLLTKEVLPMMIRAQSGCIVNIASLAGKNGVKNGACYAATKWGLRGFAASLMLEVREHRIRVATIFPGSVDTTFSSRGAAGRQITRPEDVAEAVILAATMPERTMVSEIDVRPTRP